MIQWLKYFLTGIIETADKSVNTLSKVIELKAELERKITKDFGKKSNNAIILLQFLFKKPVVYVNEVKEVTGLSYKAANDLVLDFVNQKILAEMTGQSRNRVFVFDEYLKLV
jgi:Fic family protein